MKKTMLLFLVCMVCSVTAVHAQELSDYVDEVKGDTLVIKTYQEMGNEPNALVNAISADTEAPEGRVYELKRDGWYPLLEDITTPEDRPLVIAGQGETRVVNGTEEDGYPAVISGIQVGDEVNEGELFYFQNDLTVKNASMVNGANNGAATWTFFYASSANNTVNLENVMMETTLWVFLQSNDNPGTSLNISDSYFVNMIGEPCRRNGGVYDNVSNNTQAINVENTTHVMGAGVTYKMRSFPVNEVVFNHNTFVNISGQVLASWGNQSNYIATNNLFVNANVQGYIPGLDYGEFDQDFLPHGLINIDTLRSDRGGEERLMIPDSSWITENYDMAVEDFGPDDRKVLVSHNGVFWHEKMDEIVQRLNDNNVPCAEGNCVDGEDTWVSQAITMNSRTQAMFDDNETYPYLTEGPWIMGGDPGFTDDGGLLSEDEMQNLVDWSVDAAGSEPSGIMTHWRSEGNEISDPNNYVWSDYPVNADLSYTNSDYLSASTDGQPLGDLNWFPDEKTTWVANKDAHYTTLRNALESGEVPTSIEKKSGSIPNSIQLDQNYPNPFNPTTQISFTLPQSQEVTLKVYDLLGREVMTIANNERFSAGQNFVSFDARNLSSGMYIYRLTSGDMTLSKKMTLIK